MEQPEAQVEELHPFEQFKATMRKLATVSKADLIATLKDHQETKTKRNPGPKPKSRKANQARKAN
jgi:hypothetical protein